MTELMKPPPGGSFEDWAWWLIALLVAAIAGLALRYDTGKTAEISYLKAMLDRLTAENRELTRSVASMAEILERRR